MEGWRALLPTQDIDHSRLQEGLGGDPSLPGGHGEVLWTCEWTMKGSWRGILLALQGQLETGVQHPT